MRNNKHGSPFFGRRGCTAGWARRKRLLMLPLFLNNSGKLSKGQTSHFLRVPAYELWTMQPRHWENTAGVYLSWPCQLPAFIPSVMFVKHCLDTMMLPTRPSVVWIQSFCHLWDVQQKTQRTITEVHKTIFRNENNPPAARALNINSNKLSLLSITMLKQVIWTFLTETGIKGVPPEL